MNQSENEKRQLKTLLCKKKMQARYLLISTGTIVSMMLIIMLTVYLTFLYGIEKMSLEFYDISKIRNILIWLTCVLLFETIIFSLFACWLSLRLSHKIAGPLFRIERCLMEQLESGPFEIKIRKNDELHDFVQILNMFIKEKCSEK